MFKIEKTAFFLISFLISAIWAEETVSVDPLPVDTVIWGEPSSHPPGPRSVPRVDSRRSSAQIVPLEMNTLPCGCSVLRGKHRHFPKTKASIGMGHYVYGDFGGGVEWPNAGERMLMPFYGYGVYLFFDVEYIELSFGLSTGGWDWKSGYARDAGELPYMARSFANIGLTAKYPLSFDMLPERLKVYPMLGFDYATSHSARLKLTSGNDYVFDGGEEPGGGRRPHGSDLSALWVKFGGGSSVDLRGFSVRAELLYGVRRTNKYERESVDAERQRYPDARSIRGHGLELRVGGAVDIKIFKWLGELTSM